jgi:DNA polymerase
MPEIDLLIDWETFYSTKDGVSVSTQGNFNYTRDGYGYILSLVDMNGPFQFCGTPEQLARTELPFDLEEANPWAVNSNFDQSWWEVYFPAFRRQWQCVSDLATHHQFPRALAPLAHAVMGERVVDKKARDEMDGVHWNQLDADGKTRMIKYCLNDSVISARVKNKLPPMTDFEAAVAAHTRRINREGIMINTDLLERDIARLYDETHRAVKRIPWTEEVNPKTKKLAAPLSMPYLHRWCAMNGIPAPESRSKDSTELDDLMTDNPTLAVVIGDMRELVKANTLLEKALAVRARVNDDGIMPTELLYCGAPHTRRWSSKGVNIQNLDMFPIPFGADEETASNAAKEEYGDQCWRYFTGGVWSRRWLVPRPGKRFLILDYAQIEPRCLAWLVDDKVMLDYARSGMSLYEAHARATMGWRGGNLKKENPKLYKLAKARVLGLGYGCGRLKFITVAKAMANLTVTLEESIVNVQAYRASNPLVSGDTGIWSRFDEVIANTMRERGDHHLDIALPSGENMRHWYMRPQYVVEPETKERTLAGWMSLTVKNDPSSASYRLWGGKLTENVVQRMARDILADAVLRLDAAGLAIRFTSHDEVILEVDADNAQDAKKEATNIMRTPPVWCWDLPLDVEGDLYDHYVK